VGVGFPATASEQNATGETGRENQWNSRMFHDQLVRCDCRQTIPQREKRVNEKDFVGVMPWGWSERGL
jgi:hypothetical protein